VKAIGNYAACFHVQKEAKAAGFAEVLFLDAKEEKYVEETGGANFFCVLKDKTIVTPGLQGTILAGITRASLAQLMREKGYKVKLPLFLFSLSFSFFLLSFLFLFPFSLVLFSFLFSLLFSFPLFLFSFSFLFLFFSSLFLFSFSFLFYFLFFSFFSLFSFLFSLTFSFLFSMFEIRSHLWFIIGSR